MDPIVLLLAVLVKKLLDFLRYLVHGDVNGIVTQILTWLIGILVVYCVVWASWAGFPESTWQRVLWGVLVGSFASVLHDLLCSIGHAWSNRHLVEPVPPVTPVPPAATP